MACAGFVDIDVDLVKLACRSRSAEDFAIGLVRGSPVSGMIAERGVDMDRIVKAVAAALAKNLGDKPFESTMQALVWEARKG